MKRTLALVLTSLALVLGAPAAQATTDGWCLVPGSDVCRRYAPPVADGWCQDSADSCRAATPPATEDWCSDATIQDVPHAISIEDQVLGQAPCT